MVFMVLLCVPQGHEATLCTLCARRATRLRVALHHREERLHQRRHRRGDVGGPRTKTPAENRMWHRLGAQVNSMTLAPEVILANELEIPCAGLVVGHKYSVPDVNAPEDEEAVAATLDRSRLTFERIVRAFLFHAMPVAFGNHLFRFSDPENEG